MEVSKETQKAFIKAKIGLMTAANGKPDLAFLASMLLSLRHEWDNVGTACTNGLMLKIDPDFWMNKCDEETRKGLLAHEVFHCALLHMHRRNHRDPQLWNYAADYVVNDMVLALGLKLPPTDLINDKYRNWTTENIYDDLVQNNPNPQRTYGMDISEEFGDGSEGEGGGGSAAAQKALEEVKAAVAQAHHAASSIAENPTEKWGYASGELNRMVQELFNPKLPWNRLLQKYMNQVAKEDYSTKRFNRRFMPKHYLPTLYSEKIVDINVYIDTSGSVSEKDFKVFLSECASIKRLLKPKQMRFYSWDSTLYAPTTVKGNMSVAHVKMQGGGGTNIEPVLADIEQTSPKISLIFTDGYFSKKDAAAAAKKSNLLWLIYDNPTWTSPNGKVIHFDKDSYGNRN